MTATTMTRPAPVVRRPVRPVAGQRPAAPARTAPRALRLTRRGRLAVVLAVLALLVVGLSALGIATQAAGTPAHRVAPRTVTVAPGETLWQLAERVAPSVDPRIVVERIQQLNSLPGSQIFPGQQLVVPRAQ